MKARGKDAPGTREEAGLYSAVAPVYDRLGEHISYVDYADFIAANADEMGIPGDSLGFDAGCGTGVLTCLLTEKGYDMIGADVSPEMLSLASARAQREGKRILFLLQDLRSFELYGTVKLTVWYGGFAELPPETGGRGGVFRSRVQLSGAGRTFSLRREYEI